jgi:hypothetical protein
VSSRRGGAAAGLALAAAGMLYSRLTGRRERGEQAPPLSDDAAPRPSGADVERARAELADELARHASSSER